MMTAEKTDSKRLTFGDEFDPGTAPLVASPPGTWVLPSAGVYTARTDFETYDA